MEVGGLQRNIWGLRRRHALGRLGLLPLQPRHVRTPCPALFCLSVRLSITCGVGLALAWGRVRGLGLRGGLAGGDVHPQEGAGLGPALRGGLSHHFWEGHCVTKKAATTPGGRHT